MKRTIAIAAAVLTVLVAPNVHAEPEHEGTVERRTHTNPDGSREYLLYTPRKLAPAKKRALIVYLHGCGQTATETMDGVPWNALADEHGFPVVYPEQGSDSHCWNYADGGLTPRETGEVALIAAMTRTVRDEFGVPDGRVFIAGISSGAIMSASVAATFPELYAAMGSVVGCGYHCGDATGALAHQRMGEHARRVPGFFVAGTLDPLINMGMSQQAVAGWAATNDFADDGVRNESVSSQPVVEHHGFDHAVTPGAQLCDVEKNLPCPAGLLGWDRYPTTISRYNDDRNAVVVESWILHGLTHNYPGGHPTDGTFTDPYGPDITTPMLEFFLANAG